MADETTGADLRADLIDRFEERYAEAVALAQDPDASGSERASAEGRAQAALTEIAKLSGAYQAPPDDAGGVHYIIEGLPE